MNAGQAMGYLLAAHVQAVALIMAAIWAGDWLNARYGPSFNWYWVTCTVAVLGIAQTFFVVIRQVVIMDRKNRQKPTDVK